MSVRRARTRRPDSAMRLETGVKHRFEQVVHPAVGIHRRAGLSPSLGMLGNAEDKASAGAQDPPDLRQGFAGIGHMLEHIFTDHQIERSVLEGQRGQVFAADPVPDAPRLDLFPVLREDDARQRTDFADHRAGRLGAEKIESRDVRARPTQSDSDRRFDPDGFEHHAGNVGVTLARTAGSADRLAKNRRARGHQEGARRGTADETGFFEGREARSRLGQGAQHGREALAQGRGNRSAFAPGPPPGEHAFKKGGHARETPPVRARSRRDPPGKCHARARERWSVPTPEWRARESPSHRHRENPSRRR